jgi:hypothetical protein
VPQLLQLLLQLLPPWWRLLVLLAPLLPLLSLGDAQLLQALPASVG